MKKQLKFILYLYFFHIIWNFDFQKLLLVTQKFFIQSHAENEITKRVISGVKSTWLSLRLHISKVSASNWIKYYRCTRLNALMHKNVFYALVHKTRTLIYYLLLLGAKVEVKKS